MLTHLVLAIAMFGGLGLLLILQFNAIRQLTAGVVIAPAPLRVPQKRQHGRSQHQAAVDAWENEGGAARRSKL
jgi:hypothetical protein